jgi:hypothetical protein
MFWYLFILPLLCICTDQPTTSAGTIQGVVVDGTHENQLLANVKVVLCAGEGSGVSLIAETQTDIYGKFVFDNLPLDESVTLLPGAQRDGVHYPGNRIRLGPNAPSAHSRIIAFDAIDSPSPLRADSVDIEVWTKRDRMQITETLVVDNPSRMTYVGEPFEDKGRVSLRLSIPSEFERVTFNSEFYGRRFRVVDHQPTTDIPWPPGRRELKYSYQLPLQTGAGVFRRALDLPSSKVQVKVRSDDMTDVSCNLSQRGAVANGFDFSASKSELSSGFIIELQVGAQPINWMLYARWGSLGVVGLLAVGTAAIYRWRQRNLFARSNVTGRSRKAA